MEGTATINLDSLNRLRDENKKFKEENAKLKKQMQEIMNVLSEKNTKVICKTTFIVRDYEMFDEDDVFNVFDCVNETVTTDVTIKNFDDVKKEVEDKIKDDLVTNIKNETEQSYNNLVNTLQRQINEKNQLIESIRTRSLWKRILNK